MKILKSTLILILILPFLLFPMSVSADNTHTIDLEFDSPSPQYLSHADNSNLDLTSSLTIELWANFESDTGANMGLVNKNTFADPSSSGHRAYSFYYQGSTDELAVVLNNCSAQTEFSRAWVPTLGTWYRITLLLDGTNTAIYIDGAQQGATTSSAVTPCNSDAPLEVGSLNAGSSPFDGFIDEVRLFSKARYPTDANQEICDDEDNLQAYWKLNDALTNSASSTLTLTNNNSAVFQTGDLPFTTDSCAAPAPAAVPRRKRVIIINYLDKPKLLSELRWI